MGVPTIAFEMSGPLRIAVLAGDWTLTGLEGRLDALRAQLAAAEAGEIESWNLAAVSRLDSLGASVLWRGWGDRLPDRLEADPRTRRMLESAATLGVRRRAGAQPSRFGDSVVALGRVGIALWRQLIGMIALTGQMLFDLAAALRRPHDAPLRELSANLYKTGVTALPITALVGFLIGVVLSYLSALQLKTFGADVFIINILGIGIVRELGPVLVAVLVAGRSGSAMTAQLGVMRVTEEIDALTTMGVPATLRLVLPKVLALLAAMPLLVLWTSSAALFGGMVAASIQLDISYGFFLETLPRVVPIANLYIGLGKGLAFGLVIALVACHFGLTVKPNTESLSANTTRSVVSAITCVILVDAVFAIATRHIGMPT
ncbi:MAG: MlaE family ABC transporter permease [Pseudomonadota bacterium]